MSASPTVCERGAGSVTAPALLYLPTSLSVARTWGCFCCGRCAGFKPAFTVFLAPAGEHEWMDVQAFGDLFDLNARLVA